MRLLIYEYITGGGLFTADASELGALRPEGEAMVAAIASQFAQVADVEVDVLRDAGLPPPSLPVNVHYVVRAEDELGALTALAAMADWTILIAPEIDGILLDRARLVERAGGRLLSPASKAIALASDKRRTTTKLRGAGIGAPRSVQIDADEHGIVRLPWAFFYPAVLKRIDGAGSLGMRRVEHADAALELGSGRWMLEEFVPGLAVSTAVLCGPSGHVVLPPFTQHLDPATFGYSGGSRLQGANVERRARNLAGRAADMLPEPVGYIGVDMILGEDSSGRDDAVVEINPRLTTSLVGLCAIARTNLAEAMLNIACGRLTYPEFTDDSVSFTVDGTVVRLPALEHCES